ncbi:MAG TPA: M50 family metallopeptidase [Candidatus Sulfotelmatobacter sp.]|nr:M50 family metallopeptidase [Candidatus Sulfotelmatobacter sp.]
MLKWLKFFIAILLLPACAGMAMALGAVLRASGSADTTWIPFLAGAACWCVIYFMLPKPMWIYVFGHELTHALWAWLFGARIKKMKVTSNGGHIVVTKTNFLITLAPYFFPLYAVVVIAIFAFGHWIWGWSRFLVYFHLLVGAAYAFHVTLTFQTLQTQQSDVTSQGYLFSGVIIFVGNAAILLFGIPLLAESIPMTKALNFWFRDTITVLHWLQKLV